MEDFIVTPVGIYLDRILDAYPSFELYVLWKMLRSTKFQLKKISRPLLFSEQVTDTVSTYHFQTVITSIVDKSLN